MQTEVSYDGGSTWQDVTTTKEEGNNYTAELDLPAESEDPVSLRVSAQDADGNTVTQKLSKAFALTAS